MIKQHRINMKATCVSHSRSSRNRSQRSQMICKWIEKRAEIIDTSIDHRFVMANATELDSKCLTEEDNHLQTMISSILHLEFLRDQNTFERSIILLSITFIYYFLLFIIFIPGKNFYI